MRVTAEISQNTPPAGNQKKHLNTRITPELIIPMIDLCPVASTKLSWTETNFRLTILLDPINCI